MMTTPVAVTAINLVDSQGAELMASAEQKILKLVNFQGAYQTTAEIEALANPAEGWWAISIETGVLVYTTGSWQVKGGASGPQDFYEFTDNKTGHLVRFAIRDGQLVVTDTQSEIVSTVDLGSTTVDSSRLFRTELNGNGQYTTVSPATFGNGGGLITQEFINSPGQFFVIEDINGGVFGGGERQTFALVRETIIDGTDLDGVEALWAGSNYGGSSFGPTWYYTGGFPYAWTTYTRTQQSPQGLGEVASGTFSSQTYQRNYWGACVALGLGVKIRLGIANGTLTQQDGSNFTNRLVLQLYVHQEIIDDATQLANMPSAVQTNGAGWYNCWASNGEFENMGSFPDGVDKGYRFKWSGIAGTTLNQLPYVTGVSNNDQIAAASGLQYYVSYNTDAADVAAANSVLGTGTTSANHPLYPSAPVHLLQFNTPHTFVAGDQIVISHEQAMSVSRSPLFVAYATATQSDIENLMTEVQGLQDLRKTVLDGIRARIVSYYLAEDLSDADEQTVLATFSNASAAADGGYLERCRAEVSVITATALIPQVLLDELLEELDLAIKKFAR